MRTVALRTDLRALPPAPSLQQLAVAVGLAVTALAAAVLGGWALHTVPLTTLWIGSVPMVPGTAASLGAGGLSLVLLAGPGAPLARRVGRALAAGAGVPPALGLLSYAVRGASRLRPLPTGGFADDLGAVPSVGTALALLLLSAALFTIDARTRRGTRPAPVLALCAALVPLQALLGFAYGVQPAHGQSPFTQVSLPAGIGIGLLCAGVLVARPEQGLVRVVASRGPAGFTARRLLVAIVSLPAALGWLFVVGGLRTGQYEAAVGVSLIVVSAIATGVAVVWWNAREIQRIDDRRTAMEDALRGEREWFRTTLGSIGDAVIATDDRGRVTEMNAAAEALTGRGTDDCLGQPLEGVFRAHRGAPEAPLESPFERVFAGGRVADLAPDTVLVARSGAEFPVEGCAAPIRDARGQPHGVVLVFRDIRERRRVEQERVHLLERERAARAEAEEASRAKDEFIATLSHELRTPLNSVLGWARLLRMGKLDSGGVARAVEAIERGATSQAQIVDDLIDVARIVRGQLRLDVRPVELAPVIEAAIDTVGPAASARQIEIVPLLDPKAGPVAGDPGRLQQVVWNLLTNGIKFTPPGGRVEVRLARAGDDVEVVVTDDGGGITPEFLPHVFERFRQADSSTTRAHGGLGLGLAIVRHVVEAHGGTVSAESAGPGTGATFRVRLPVFQPRRRQREALTVAARDASRRAAPESARLQGIRALVVDDDHDTLEVMRQILEMAGAQVVAATSADEALDLLRAAPPDVLLSDIGMPGKDGYELIRLVRRLPASEGGRVPAAALTAFTQSEHREHALAAGYEQYLAKPIEPSELTVAVAQLAGRPR